MNRLFLFVVCVLLTFASLSFGLVDERGSLETHDIATWNLQNFPLNDDLTVNYVTLLIRDLGLDLIACQEIESTEDFDQLVSNLNGWNGFYSPDVYESGYYQKTAILYNESTVQVGEMVQLWPDCDFAFIRPPIQFPITMIENGDTLSFTIIVLHLKAGAANQDDNLERRRAACDSLKTYMDAQVDQGNTKWMVVGDWNDTLDDDRSYNAFNVFLDDPQSYIFLTEAEAGIPSHASHIQSLRMIDHILVTAPMMNEYAGGRTETLRLDVEWNSSLYLDNVSDHRPVGTFFPGRTSAVGEFDSPLPDVIQVVAWPNPANAGFRVNYSTPQDAQLSIYNILGREIYQENGLRGTHSRFINATDWPTGLYFIRVQGEDVMQTSKLFIVR